MNGEGKGGRKPGPSVAEKSGSLIAEMRRNGFSWDTIASRIGCTRRTAWAAAKQHEMARKALMEEMA